MLAGASWQSDSVVVQCCDGVLHACAYVYVCARWIMRTVSVSLSANRWMFAGCCHFDLPSLLTFLNLG